MQQPKIRSEERVYPCDEHAGIGDWVGGRLARARVRDVSSSGIALEFDRAIREMSHGERIRVLRKGTGDVLKARVVRIEEHREDNGVPVITIGCRWIRGRGVRTRLMNKRSDRPRVEIRQHTSQDKESR
ncbi:MAG: hypothetical protein Tsb0013_06440 [Phycisphaerales bacterium]